jgi:hypothetical protein
MRYYSLDRIAALDCDYNFIVSGRGPGKSTAIVNRLTDDFADRGGEFVRIARYDWECSRVLMSSWFNEVNACRMHERLGCHSAYNAGLWYAESDEDPSVSTVMGHLVTLNNQDTIKSASFDRVTNVVYEEFAMLSDRDYMVGEVDAFLSALSTIVRRRQDVKVWFIGNTLSKHNPYFEYFGIDIDRMGIRPGDCRAFRCAGYGGHGATVAIEFANMAESDYMELSPLMRVGGNVTATTGVYDIPETVAAYRTRVEGVPDSDFLPLLPGLSGVYMGHGEFASARWSKRPLYDDMHLVALGTLHPGYGEVMHGRWLNLSGVYNPVYAPEGMQELARNLDCVNPYTMYANTADYRRFQIQDWSSVHAFETDEYEFKWRNFVDQWGYEKGRV